MPTSQADVVALRERNANVVTLAKRALVRFWATLDLSRPEAARDALVEFMPVLVAEFGQAAAKVAADWYETVRAKDVPGTFTALLADAAPVEQVAANVRFQAGHLFDGTADVMLATLQGTLQRHVVNQSRQTIQQNAGRDRARPRFARVPTGRKTCAWCTLMASRGFVYRSEASAGRFDHYHDDCDCQVVADFSDDPRIRGYDPSELYDLYSQARASSGGSTDTVIAAEMRRLFPDRFTDGVVTSNP